jgi:general secretion pathway protein I
MHCQKGMTLIESVVALAIVALALLTGLQTSSFLTFQSERHLEALLAQFCAENQLVALRLEKNQNQPTNQNIECEQANRTLTVTQVVQPTMSSDFRRVDVRISNNTVGLMQISSVIGRN